MSKKETIAMLPSDAVIQNLRMDVVDLQAALERAKTYTGLEGHPCPLCEWKDGVLIKHCSMHSYIDRLENEIVLVKAERNGLRDELNSWIQTYRWIPVSEIPQKMDGWVEFIKPTMEHGSVGGICLGTYGNIRNIKRNYTHYRPITLPKD